MKFSFRSRICAILLAMISLLFTQLALASYVCPAAGGTISASMPGCTGMVDLEQTALCHAHSQDQGSKQSLDQPQLPHVVAFIAANLLRVLVAFDFSFSEQALAAAQQPELSPLMPDIAVLHCCLRI